MAKKTKEKESESLGAGDAANAEIDAFLAENKMNLVMLAEEMVDMEVETFSTGFPQLDYLINKDNPGMPKGRHIEISSTNPSAGKTTLATQIMGAAQKQKMSGLYVDVERTQTEKYVQSLGVITSKGHASIGAMRWLRPQDATIPAEDILNTVGQAADLFDLCIVDSVAALEKKANLDKDATQNLQMGGISKSLSEYFRKNLCRKATVIWINQVREAIGAFSPSGSVVTKTTGGRALPFYCSLRLELTRMGALKSGDDVIGMETQVLLRKNKTGAPDQKTVLNFINGMGFSPEWDYLDMAIKLKVVGKKGGWLDFQGERFQGLLNTVKLMRSRPEFGAAIVAAVNAEAPAAVAEEAEDLAA